MIKLRWCLLLTLCGMLQARAQQKYVISGFIKDAASKELLIGATVAVPKFKTGTVTNAYGFYSITLPTDTFDLLISYVGYGVKAYKINLQQNQELNIELQETNKLKEAVVTAQKSDQRIADKTQMSVIEIPISQIKDIPALLGEKDVLKVIQLLPGVQKPSEGNSGIYVRGGGPDQNLIILDEAIVYNAFHLFGFFSLFNGDALKSVELTKGGFPARYGGRLSSVIDMSMKEGNKQEFKGEAGIGILSSRFMFEGPIVKNKASFLVSARRSYIDVLTLPFQQGNQKAGYYFYDLNAKVNYEFNNKNRLYLSSYFGRDKFYARSYFGGDKDKTEVSWGNITGTLRWNHLYNNKTFSNTSLIFSKFNFGISDERTYNSSNYLLSYSSGITDLSLKHDIDYRPNANHFIRLGFQAIHHQFTPSAMVIKDNLAGVDTTAKNTIPSIENGLYIEDDIKIGLRFRLNPGLRFTHFSGGKNHYFNIEPRLNSSYNIKSDLAIKFSAAIMNQYVHLLSNTGLGLPTDLWVPSSDKLKPQQSWQLAAGVAKDVLSKNFTISLEGYYKNMHNIIAYKEGSSFLAIDNASGADEYSYEENITSGKGWSYGTELLLQRKTGKLTGWIGYTLSWTKWNFDELNFGETFWAKYDRRHDISVVAIYKLREQKNDQNGITLSGTWVYGTGNAITLPIANYEAPVHDPSGKKGMNFFGNEVSQYTEKNGFRMVAYHRMDVGIQITRKMKYWLRTWEFSFYNLYNRRNPFFYFSETQPNGEVILKQLSLFPIIPSLSWNIKF